MVLTDFGAAVIEGDRLSGDVIRAGQLACQHGWLRTFAPYIPVGGVVADVGAALGDHTASYAEMVGPDGWVHAFEPYQPFFECLRHNAPRLDAHITVYDVALGAGESFAVMVESTVQPSNLGMTHLAPPRHGARVVAVRTLDEIAAEWDRLDFLKIDAEGSEPYILDGARQTIARLQPVLLIEINAFALGQLGATAADVYTRLRALGYRFGPCREGDALETPEIDVLCLPARCTVSDWRVPTLEAVMA